jgi:hypothetical protein
MKAIKLFSVACCVAAVCLTSCIGDNDSDVKSLTKAEIATCLNAVKGTHLGRVIYSAPTVKDVNHEDSVDISWTIATDSTMTIHDFPARLLAHNIDSVQGKALRTALMQAPDQDIECYIGFIDVNPVSWLINPQTATYTLNTGDGEHKVQVAFYVNSSYSGGVYSPSNKNKFAMEIIEGAIYMDGKLTSYLSKKTPFLFIRNEK